MTASSAHQPAAAEPRADQVPALGPDRQEPQPTMDQLLASCAAATAVSTPPEPPAASAPTGKDGKNGQSGNETNGGGEARRIVEAATPEPEAARREEGDRNRDAA